MPDWKHGESTPSALLEILGWMALSVSIFLVCFGSWVWAQDSMMKLDAMQNQHIAVLTSQMGDVTRRVTAIEDRLFGILLTTVGTVLASITSSVFSIRTHRRLKNGRTA